MNDNNVCGKYKNWQTMMCLKGEFRPLYIVGNFHISNYPICIHWTFDRTISLLSVSALFFFKRLNWFLKDKSPSTISLIHWSGVYVYMFIYSFICMPDNGCWINYWKWMQNSVIGQCTEVRVQRKQWKIAVCGLK